MTIFNSHFVSGLPSIHDKPFVIVIHSLQVSPSIIQTNISIYLLFFSFDECIQDEILTVLSSAVIMDISLIEINTVIKLVSANSSRCPSRWSDRHFLFLSKSNPSWTTRVFFFFFPQGLKSYIVLRNAVRGGVLTNRTHFFHSPSTERLASYTNIYSIPSFFSLHPVRSLINFVCTMVVVVLLRSTYVHNLRFVIYTYV